MTEELDPTLAFYAERAEVYADWSGRAGTREVPALRAFMARLRPGADVLELGCGGGHDSLALLAEGFRVVPSDGSPEMAREAEKRLGRPVRVMRFDELDDVGQFDGVWANACLLHAPRATLAAILARVQRALRPGGLLRASFKSGGVEGTDGLGRYFNYPSADWLEAQFDSLRWSSLDVERSQATGYDGVDCSMIWIRAVRGA